MLFVCFDLILCIQELISRSNKEEHHQPKELEMAGQFTLGHTRRTKSDREMPFLPLPTPSPS